jgi:hypothetical protein
MDEELPQLDAASPAATSSAEDDLPEL